MRRVPSDAQSGHLHESWEAMKMTSTYEQEKDQAAENAAKVGGIWYTSWGYDQTNSEHFEVVRETKASLVLRRICAEVRDGRLYPIPGAWTTDFSLMGNPGTPSRVRDEERGYSEKMCRKPRHGGVRIDECRYAWPYCGGGSYDTIAAGLPGH